MIALNILGAWVLADFLSGVAHWAQDKLLVYGKLKFFDMVIDENVIHHDKPNPWEKFLIGLNIRISVVTTWPVALALYLVHAPMVLWLCVFFLSFGNLIHWLAHQRRVHPVIRALQKTGIISSFEHHIRHHAVRGRLVKRENAEMGYCVMTCWVNPIVDALGFFAFLENAWGVFCVWVVGVQALVRTHR